MHHETQEKPDCSVIIPVYRNEENIPFLIDALDRFVSSYAFKTEVVFVIDGSPDRSGELVMRSCQTSSMSTQVIFHSRNFGSFTAIRTGLEHARGDCYAVMAADLQEPPELMGYFFKALRAGEADIVFGQRQDRNDSVIRDAVSRVFWGVYRRLIIRDIPRGGIDVFGCNQKARAALLSIVEPNSSLVAQLFWIGFRRKFIPYVRRKREIGSSSWSFASRLRYMMDSILTFSDLPVLLVMWLGAAGILLSSIFAAVSVIGRLTGAVEVEGYTTLVLLVCFFGSSLLFVNGLIGCYIWRTFENTKQRPLSIVSQRYVYGS